MDRGPRQLTDLTAAIFAGGLGTRLRSVVADRPKVLAEVLGRPFLGYLLDQLAAAGLREVVLCTGYMAELVEAAFGDRHGPLRLRYSREDAPLGTGGALRLAAPLLESDPVLVLNGDSYCGFDPGQLWQRHLDRGAAASLLTIEVPDTSRYGRVETDAKGTLLSFVEKGGEPRPGAVNAGIYLLGQPVLQEIVTGRPVSLEKEVLPSWVGRGLFGHPAVGPFLDIGTPESYAAAERFFGALSTSDTSRKGGPS